MEWKQPLGLRRHWILEDLDAELLFSSVPAGSAQGRVGDEIFDLRDGGHLRKKRTLRCGERVLATLEDKAYGRGSTLRHGEREYQWKPVNLYGTRWVLCGESGEVVFEYSARQSLAKAAFVQWGTGTPAEAGPLLLLCWYAMVL